MIDLNKTYYRVLIRVTNDCDGKEPNLYLYFSKVKTVAAAEPADLGEYHITKEQYANLPTAVIEYEGVTEQDKEVIKERLLPKIMKMIEEWNIKPKTTTIEYT